MNTRRMTQSVLATGLLALGLGGALSAHASVVVGGTRIVYNAQEREATVRLTNEGKMPALTQAWMDKGDPRAAPSAIDVPFTVTPPVARIDPAKGQTLRILYTGEPLPQDKESVFWLNVLEVPPKTTGDEASKNKLQLAFRTRIKFFFRPAALKGSATDAAAQVGWRLTQSGKKQVLEARNPTPYFVSFSALEVLAGGKAAKSEDGGMVAPGETAQFPLSNEVGLAADSKVHFRAINDWGGVIEGETPLSVTN